MSDDSNTIKISSDEASELAFILPILHLLKDMYRESYRTTSFHLDRLRSSLYVLLISDLITNEEYMDAENSLVFLNTTIEVYNAKLGNKEKYEPQR